MPTSLDHVPQQFPNRLRICLVVPYDLADRAGGVKYHAVQLGRALRAQGHDVTILGASSQPTTEPHTFGVGGMFNLRANGSDNRMALFASALKLWRFFQQNKFDIVHIHEPPVPSISYWSAWLTPGIPKMATFHAFSETASLGVKIFVHLAAALQYSFLDHATAVSVPAARHARRAWRRPLPVVPNGVPLDVFTPLLRPASPRSGRRILAIGRFADGRKGIATMVDAFRLLRAQGSSWTLDIVGEDVHSPNLPRIEGLTYHPQLALRELIDRYRDCDVFVAPSTGQESFGIVLLEAMATGKPIVCSDIEGYRNVADPAGAMLVPPGDPFAFSDALQSLFADEGRRRAMGAFNLGYVRRYDWANVALGVTKQYLVTIESHRVRRGLPPLGLVRHRAERREVPALPLMAGELPEAVAPHAERAISG